MTQRSEPSKQKRYRLKNRERGLCVRCGKPSEPYEVCNDHRIRKKLNRAVNILVKSFAVRRVFYSPGKPALWEKTGSEGVPIATKRSDSIYDRRHLPRNGKRPIFTKEEWRQFVTKEIK